MKTEKNKKSKESTIGRIIYGFLLFMPLIAIASAIVISTFNMSGKEETEIFYKYQSNEVNSNEDLIEGNIYSFNYAHLDYQSILYENNLSTIKPLTNFRVRTPIGDECYFEDDIATLPYVSISFFEEYLYINYDELGSNYSSLTYYTILDNFIGILIEDNGLNYSHISYTEYNEINHIETHNLNAENIFYRSINKVENSDLFNWSKNSVVYTTLLATCTQLSITTTFIPMLLAYWLIISVIYILYDIALIMLHIFHKKVHCIEDAV